MPFNSWNWYRAVGTGNDHKCWIGDNPQVTDVSHQFTPLYLIEELLHTTTIPFLGGLGKFLHRAGWHSGTLSKVPLLQVIGRPGLASS